MTDRSVSRPTLVQYGCLEVFVIVLETTGCGKQWAQGCSSASLPSTYRTGSMWRLRRQQSASKTEKESLNRHTEDRRPHVLVWPDYGGNCQKVNNIAAVRIVYFYNLFGNK